MTNPQTCQLDCDLCRLCVESGGWERLQKPIGDVGEERSLVAGAASNIFLLSGKPKSGDSARTNYIQVSVVSRLNSCNTTHTYYIRNTYFPMRGSFVSVCHITSVSPPKLLDDTVTKKTYPLISLQVYDTETLAWRLVCNLNLRFTPSFCGLHDNKIIVAGWCPARFVTHGNNNITELGVFPYIFMYAVRHWKFTGKLNNSLIVALQGFSWFGFTTNS